MRTTHMTNPISIILALVLFLFDQASAQSVANRPYRHQLKCVSLELRQLKYEFARHSMASIDPIGRSRWATFASNCQSLLASDPNSSLVDFNPNESPFECMPSVLVLRAIIACAKSDFELLEKLLAKDEGAWRWSPALTYKLAALSGRIDTQKPSKMNGICTRAIALVLELGDEPRYDISARDTSTSGLRDFFAWLENSTYAKSRNHVAVGNRLLEWGDLDGARLAYDAGLQPNAQESDLIHVKIKILDLVIGIQDIVSSSIVGLGNPPKEYKKNMLNDAIRKLSEIANELSRTAEALHRLRGK